VKLIAVGAAARPAWHEALAADGDALVSQTPAWIDAVCASTGYDDVTRAYETDDGRRLVLPLMRRAHVPVALASEQSLPFGWGSGGLVATGRVSRADVAAVLADLARRPTLATHMRPSPAADGLWAGARGVRIRRTAYALDLDAGFDELWAHRFTGKVRRYCRKAERLGLVVESDCGGRLIPVFDRLYRRSVDRWAQQQHEPLALARWRARRRDPVRKFEAVARHLGAACRVWVASRDGEPAASIIVLRHGSHATYWRGAMDKELVGPSGANELLHRLAIEDACAGGARWYHMGDTTPGSPLARFKRGFGAGEQAYSGYRLERLPVTALEQGARRTVKRALRFRDA
jgi:GNAT acetyltransferase-like protein